MKMKPTITLLLGVFFAFCTLNAQNAPRWASSLVGKSSEFYFAKYPGQYDAEEALGPPSVMPGFGASAAAWVSKEANAGPEWIHVGYETAEPVRQVIIAQNFNPGAITRVTLLDETGDAHEVYSNPAPGPTGNEKGEFLNIILEEETPYSVKEVRIELNCASVKGFNQIDAVGLSRSAEKWVPIVKVSPAAGLVETPEKLPAEINTEHDELSPVISPDGKTLFYTVQGSPENLGEGEVQDIWWSAITDNGNFARGKNIGPPLSTPRNNSVLSITPDGQKLLLLNVYKPDGGSEAGLSMSKKTADGWEFPEKLEIKNYYNNHKYGEYCLSNSGKILVMALMRDDGEGSKDLYVSFLNEEDNTWSEPRHMGPMVNTAESEVSPFLAADDRTLYFATKGYPGFGGSDMFISRRLDDSWTNWSEPENMGPVLNSSGFDAYYTLTADGEYAYFVSYGDNGENADIYRAKLPTELRPDAVVLVKGKVFNKKTGDILQADVSYEDLEGGKSLGIARTDPVTGLYQIVLPAGRQYGFRASSEGFVSVGANLDLTELKSYKEITQDLELVPFEVGETVLLNNIFFDYDKANLKPISKQELNRLADIMKNNPKMKIEVMGHTDDQGSDVYNQNLSQKRANSVLEYLAEQGIEPNRLTAKGYGEIKPIVPNDTPENRARNRRVEFLILGK